MSYKYRVEKRHYLFVDGGIHGGDRFVGVVEFCKRGEPAEKAAETRPYNRTQTANLQAARLCKQYQAYFDREGERWEVLQRQKREAKAERNRVEGVQKRIDRDFRTLDRDVQLDVLAALRAICPE